MKLTASVFLFALILTSCNTQPPADQSSIKTVCNPVNISYRFGLELPSRREAADPTVVRFKDRYFLFASKSGGYWHSQDLVEWTFIETNQIPTEEYAPTVIEIKGTLYFLASSNEKSTIYKTTDPLSGQWSIAVDQLELPVWDPAFFLDEDNRLYLYWGCSNTNPIYGVEVDYKNNFSFLGKPTELFSANTGIYGWEVPGDYNTLVNQAPWIEGAWVNKHKGRYYLQYAGPGTEFKSYSDAVYMSDTPLGPFTSQLHNPFAYKPEGFAAGAGHGSTFADEYGNLWHIGTITISQKHMFERRLGLYPAFFDENGTLYTMTKYGDYPMVIPRKKINRFEDVFSGWMLLSFGKRVEVSSAIDSLPAPNLTDEDIRTYWAAQSGGPTEYATVDLGGSYDVYAVQLNFAEHNTTLLGRTEGAVHGYTVEYSEDGTNWTLLADKSENESDKTHEYLQLKDTVTCRYVKVKNVAVPDGNFAISDLRVFGKGFGSLPEKISRLEAVRNPDDRRSVRLTWEKSTNATGYTVTYGNDRNTLYHSYQVYSDTILTINSLNANRSYSFSIESFNENGITAREEVVVVE